MILFRDILKEAYGELEEESDFIDSDFSEIPEGALRVKDLSGEDLQENPNEKIKVKKPVKRPNYNQT